MIFLNKPSSYSHHMIVNSEILLTITTELCGSILSIMIEPCFPYKSRFFSGKDSRFPIVFSLFRSLPLSSLLLLLPIPSLLLLLFLTLLTMSRLFFRTISFYTTGSSNRLVSSD